MVSKGHPPDLVRIGCHLVIRCLLESKIWIRFDSPKTELPGKKISLSDSAALLIAIFVTFVALLLI